MREMRSERGNVGAGRDRTWEAGLMVVAGGKEEQGCRLQEPK